MRFLTAFKNENKSIFELAKGLGCLVVNQHCLFLHPFAFNKGKKILLGSNVSQGCIVDNEGRHVFSRHLRKLLESNSYPEEFSHLLFQSASKRGLGHGIFFSFGGKTIRLVPSVHYTAGGIKTNFRARAIGCKNLFVVGECAADGSRNGGRLPGFPFTAAIVYGKTLGEELG